MWFESHSQLRKTSIWFWQANSVNNGNNGMVTWTNTIFISINCVCTLKAWPDSFNVLKGKTIDVLRITCWSENYVLSIHDVQHLTFIMLLWWIKLKLKPYKYNAIVTMSLARLDKKQSKTISKRYELLLVTYFWLCNNWIACWNG